MKYKPFKVSLAFLLTKSLFGISKEIVGPTADAQPKTSTARLTAKTEGMSSTLSNSLALVHPITI